MNIGKKLTNYIHYAQVFPPGFLLARLKNKLFPKTLDHRTIVLNECANKKGLEIGGPSILFSVKGYCPLYPYVQQIDSVNFSTSTVWEGNINEGMNFKYSDGKTGWQWIADASDLQRIETASYDFLLSSNALEHIANPLKAIEEWKRVLKPNSAMLLVLPKKESNFDHKRPVTKFQHLLDDYNNNTPETDHTHLPEILQLHNLKRDLPAGSLGEFKHRSENNFYNRCLHHHVFDLDLLNEITDFFDMQLLFKESSLIEYFIMVRK